MEYRMFPGCQYSHAEKLGVFTLDFESDQLIALKNFGFSVSVLASIVRIYGQEARRPMRDDGRRWYYDLPHHFVFKAVRGVGGCNQVVSFYCPPIFSTKPDRGWELLPVGDQSKMTVMMKAVAKYKSEIGAEN